jgi:hypothetical protein
VTGPWLAEHLSLPGTAQRIVAATVGKRRIVERASVVTWALDN